MQNLHSITSVTTLPKELPTCTPGTGRSDCTSAKRNGGRFAGSSSASVRHDHARRYSRPATPAERIRFKWFCIGAGFAWAVTGLLVLWADAAGGVR